MKIIYMKGNENMIIYEIKVIQYTMDFHKKSFNPEVIKGYYFNIKVKLLLDDIILFVFAVVKFFVTYNKMQIK